MMMCVVAGYYSCLSYSTAQLLIEVPYLLGLAIMFVSIVSTLLRAVALPALHADRLKSKLLQSMYAVHRMSTGCSRAGDELESHQHHCVLADLPHDRL